MAASCSNSRRCSEFRIPRRSRAGPRPRWFRRLRRIPRDTTTCPAGNCFCRPSRHLSPEVTSMITTGSVRGKCSALQFGAVALPAAFLHRGAGSAIGAVAVALMPAHHRFRHRDRRELVGRHHALHRHAAQFGDGDVVAGQQFFHCRGGDAHAEHRRAVAQAQKDRAGIGAEFQRFVDAQQCARAVRLLLHHQRVAMHHIGAGIAVAFQRKQFFVVAAQMRGAIENVA